MNIRLCVWSKTVRNTYFKLIKKLYNKHFDSIPKFNKVSSKKKQLLLLTLLESPLTTTTVCLWSEIAFYSAFCCRYSIYNTCMPIATVKSWFSCSNGHWFLSDIVCILKRVITCPKWWNWHFMQSNICPCMLLFIESI